MKKHFIVDISGVLLLTNRWGNTRTNIELIDYLVSQKDRFNYTLLTNNPPEIEHHIEAAYKIPKFYGHFISSGHYDLAKSDPKLYEEVMAKLQATPEQCIFVDDTKENVKAAQSLGIRSILYTGLENLKKELEKI